MSFSKYIFNSMKKYRFISPMRKRELEEKAAIYRKKWKARMFLQSGSFFNHQNPKCGWEDNAPTINMPQSKEDVKMYFRAHEKFTLENANNHGGLWGKFREGLIQQSKLSFIAD